MIKVLFVCLGNICRSPTAHGIFVQRLQEAGLEQRVWVDSAGTGDWHIGRAPDPRTQEAAALRGYDLSALRARQVTPADFDAFDYILAMDRANLDDLRDMRPLSFQGELALFLDYAASSVREVPDPYYGGSDGFDRVLDLVEAGADGLLAALRQRHGLD